MAFFAWNETFSVDVQELDEHHQYLVSIINQLYTAMKEGKGDQELDSILARLLEYTQFHFEYEENAMREAGYPGYQQHHLRHQELTAQVRRFQQQFAGNSLGMSVRMANFLKEWLFNHIQKEDKKYAAYLQKVSPTRTGAAR